MALTLVAGMAIPCQANAQGVIKGTVTISSTHEKFAGARITVIGTKNVAMSDENGAFELKDAAQNSVLQIEAPGCELQIVALQGRKDLAIQVVPVSSSKPFYTSEALSSLTSYHNEDMAKTALSASEDIDIHLNGAVRNIRQSGIDAIGSNILVRGIHSANMTNTPLYVESSGNRKMTRHLSIPVTSAIHLPSYHQSTLRAYRYSRMEQPSMVPRQPME